MFEINEYTFQEISAERGEGIKYFKDVLELISKHEDKLLSDYLPHSPEGLIELIDSLFPFFFVVLKGDKFLGFIYCYGWIGTKKNPHSWYLTAAATREFYGVDTRRVLALFCNFLYDVYNLVKIKVEVLKENRLCIKLLEDCRFKKEGYLKSNTSVKGELKDVLLYGRINPNRLKTINQSKEKLIQV